MVRLRLREASRSWVGPLGDPCDRLQGRRRERSLEGSVFLLSLCSDSRMERGGAAASETQSLPFRREMFVKVTTGPITFRNTVTVL